MTSFTDSRTVTVNIKSPYGGTGAADKAEMGGYSSSSFNADEQRAIINQAVAAGTQVKYVFSGHMHKSTQLTVNGVTYFGFLNAGGSSDFQSNSSAGDNSASSIITLSGDSIDIAGIANGGMIPASYNHSAFFVDGVNGNDANAGTVKENAWKTLNRALKAGGTAGNVINILPATYSEYISYWPAGGTQDKPVTWVYQPGAKQICASKDASAPGTAFQIPTGVSYLTVQGGEFSGCRTAGISIQGNNITISGVTSKGNASGISYTSAGAGNLITKSWFTDNDTSGIGIYQGAPTITYSIAARNQTGFDITNALPNIYNVVSYGNQWGFGIGNNSVSPGPMIRNAISQGNTKGGINSYGSGVSAVSNSIVADGGKWGNTTKSSISTDDPRFTDPSGGNFNPLSGSPAIDFGMDIGLTEDFVGNSIQGKPDAGVFEYNSYPTGSQPPSSGARSDLVPTDFAGPATAKPGQAITLSWTVKNQGEGDAVHTSTTQAWEDRVYISSNNTYDSSAFYLGKFIQPTVVSAGGTYTATISVPLSSKLSGNYYLILRVDNWNDALESDNNNNQKVLPITISQR